VVDLVDQVDMDTRVRRCVHVHFVH